MIVAKVPRVNSNVRLSGLAGADLDAAMVQGANYTFLFNYGRAGIAQDPADVSKWVATDSNFKNPVSTVKSGFFSNQVAVSFTYNGKGSSVRNAGVEMQNVINSRLTLTRLYFDSAEGPELNPLAPGAGAGQNNNSSGFSYADVLSLIARAGTPSPNPQAPVPWGTVALAGGAAILGTAVVVKLFGGRR